MLITRNKLVKTPQDTPRKASSATRKLELKIKLAKDGTELLVVMQEQEVPKQTNEVAA